MKANGDWGCSQEIPVSRAPDAVLDEVLDEVEVLIVDTPHCSCLITAEVASREAVAEGLEAASTRERSTEVGSFIARVTTAQSLLRFVFQQCTE